VRRRRRRIVTGAAGDKERMRRMVARMQKWGEECGVAGCGVRGAGFGFRGAGRIAAEDRVGRTSGKASGIGNMGFGWEEGVGRLHFPVMGPG